MRVKEKRKVLLFALICEFLFMTFAPTQLGNAATITYQAENATFYQAVTETVNAGYTGASYVNYDNVTGSYVEWTVNAASEGTSSLVFTYANGTTVDRPMEIKVNGTIVADSQSFAPTGAWTTWNTTSINVNLNAGNNIIRATATTVNGGPNVDKLDVNTASTSPNYQAEDAVLSQAVTETVNAGYTGESYVNYDNVTGSYVEWTVNAASEGTSSLLFTYANGTTVDRPMEIKVNGTVVADSQSFAPTGAWTTWNTVSINVNLIAGNNIIRATATTANGGPNVDKLDIDVVLYEGTNLAEGKTATADSTLSGYTASNGNDSSTTTRWCAADVNDNHYWVVDLGDTYYVTGTEIMFEKNVAYRYRIETSTDNSNWTLRIDKSNNNSTTQIQNDNFSGLARYLKIIFLDIPTDDLASFYDLQVFGTASNKTMVFIAGDSTVQTYSTSFAPQAGWGQFIQEYCTSDVNFDNRAIGGRSSKSFIVEGRLDAILSVIQENDFLLIQFGHNDASTIEERHTDPYTTYKDYLEQYIDGAREHGAIPILITPVARLNYSNGEFINDFPDYVTAMKQVGTETSTPCVDLMTLTRNTWTSLGYNTVYPYYLVSYNGTDYTHFTLLGADKVADILTNGLKTLNCPFSQYVN